MRIYPKRRGSVPSYLALLFILLVGLAGLPFAHVAPSLAETAGSAGGTITTTANYGTSATTIAALSTVQTSSPAATNSLSNNSQNTMNTIRGRLAIVYPTDYPARYYLLDDLGPIELILSPTVAGDLDRYAGATIEVSGSLVGQDSLRILYVEKWAPLEVRPTGQYPAVSGPQSTVVILVEFSDNTASRTPAEIGQLVFATSGNAMNAYYVEVSYNSITVTGGYTSVWNKLSHQTTYYNVHEWGSSWSEYRKLAVDVVNLVDSYVNFASYQHYMMVFAGDWVWGARCSGLAISTADGVLVDTAAFLRETYEVNTYAHEFGHDLGLPDLYDYGDNFPPTPCGPSTYPCDSYQFVDGWDEMSMNNAQHFSSWSKIFLGWISASKITTYTSGTVTTAIDRIEYSTSGYQTMKIKTSTMPSNFYFLVETRQKVGFDVNIPSSAPDHGVLITKIDESKGSGHGIVRLVDANPSTQSRSDGDAVWQAGQTYADSTYGFSVYVQSWTGTGFMITVSLTNAPYVSTDKATYAQGDHIQFSGTGFTPGGSVLGCLTTDNDNSFICETPGTIADGQGNAAGQMHVGTNIPSGPQKFAAWDVSLGSFSNAVQLTIFQYFVCTYVDPNNIGGSFTLNGVTYGDGQRAPVLADGTSYPLVGSSVGGYSFDHWSSARSVHITNTGQPSTTVSFDSSGWDGVCLGGIYLVYAKIQTATKTVTSTQTATSTTSRTITTKVTSYTSTSTSTSTIPALTTVVLVPVTATSTVRSTQFLTSPTTTTITSYTSTKSSTSTVVVPTTVTVGPTTMTTTVQTTQVITSTVYSTTVTASTTATSTSYTSTTTSTSTTVVYTTVTRAGASVGTSNSLVLLGLLSLLAVTTGQMVMASNGWKIPRLRMGRRCSGS